MSYINKFVESLKKNNDDWTHKDSEIAIDLLHGAFYGGEVNLRKIEYSKIKWAFTNLLDIMCGEYALGENCVHSEIHSSLLAIAQELGFITSEENGKIRWMDRNTLDE